MVNLIIKYQEAPVPVQLTRKASRFSERGALTQGRAGDSLSRRSSGASLRGKRRGTPDSLDLVFSALSSPTRRAILDRLSRGESSVTELAAPFAMSLPAISKHLRVLEKAEVISKVKEGRVYRCRLEPESLQRAARWINSYGALWERQLDSLSDYLEKEE
jgi:DNA-binding transcriptional ArsR family regulator